MRYLALPAVAVVFALTFIVGSAAFKAPAQKQAPDATVAKPADRDAIVNPAVSSRDPISSEAQDDSQLLESARRMVTSLETLIAVSASGPELFTSVREPGLRAEFQEYVARCRAYLHALKTAYANRDATELRRIGGQYRGFAEESKQWMAKLEALSAKLRSDSPSRQPSLAEVQGPNFERKMNSLTFDQRVHVWAEQFCVGSA